MRIIKLDRDDRSHSRSARAAAAHLKCDRLVSKAGRKEKNSYPCRKCNNRYLNCCQLLSFLSYPCRDIVTYLLEMYSIFCVGHILWKAEQQYGGLAQP